MFLSSKKGIAKKCAFECAEKAVGEPKKRLNSVVVARTLDYTQAEDKITSLKFMAKGDLLHRRSAIAANSCFTEKWEGHGP